MYLKAQMVLDFPKWNVLEIFGVENESYINNVY